MFLKDLGKTQQCSEVYFIVKLVTKTAFKEKNFLLLINNLNSGDLQRESKGANFVVENFIGIDTV